jgi:hypothetical protein
MPFALLALIVFAGIASRKLDKPANAQQPQPPQQPPQQQQLTQGPTQNLAQHDDTAIAVARARAAMARGYEGEVYGTGSLGEGGLG